MQKTVVILKELFYFSLQVSPEWISRWSESLRPILISSSDQSLLSFWQGAERMGERSPRNHWAVRLKKTLFRKYLSIHKCFEMLHLWLPTACLPYISVNLVDVIFFFPHSFMKRKGIIVNETAVVLYGQLLTGRKYIPKANGAVELEKQWSKQVFPFAYQTVVKVHKIHTWQPLPV